MNWKILFIISALFLIIGAGCETSENKDSMKKDTAENTENPDNQYYDNLDDTLDELDELEQTGN